MPYPLSNTLAFGSWGVFYHFPDLSNIKVSEIANENLKSHIWPIYSEQIEQILGLDDILLTLPQVIDIYDQANEAGNKLKKEFDHLFKLLSKYISEQDRSAIENVEYRLTFISKILLTVSNHTKSVISELDKYAKAHGTTAEEIYSQKLSCGWPYGLENFFKGQHDKWELADIVKYGDDLNLSESLEKKAFRQFVNHSVIPHIDYFEIWASKMADISVSPFVQYIQKNELEDRPPLEILGEKRISLSGLTQFSESAESLPYNPGSIKAQNIIDEYRVKAQARVVDLLFILHDATKGNLKDRHAALCRKTVEYIQEFTHFFSGIDIAIRKCDQELNKIIPQIEKMEGRWNNYIAQETQLRLLGVRDPEETYRHNSGVNVMTIGAGLALDAVLNLIGIPSTHTIAAIGSMIAGGEIRSLGNRIRQEQEQAIYRWSIDNQRKIDPESVRNALDHLDESFEELSENKEFLYFLSVNPTLEDIRALYMLLPRLVAGENNIDVIEGLIKKTEYKCIDDFILDLDKDNRRLAKAIENFLFGLADSNDLKVLIAEANVIEEPKSSREAVLVNYVEKAIKTHYRDQSRQASIIDYLQMRNVIYTGCPFYSFGEIVKSETDSALKALLEGKDNFTLIGSNDVHQMFDYYQSRYGESFFVDLFDRNRRELKVVNVVDPELIKAKGKDAAFARDANTKIPRINNSLFIEICAYELLLSQNFNIVKDRCLSNCPQSLGTFEMVNHVTTVFIKKLALNEARQKNKKGEKIEFLAPAIESLIAQSFIDFYSELGASQSRDEDLQEKSKKLRNAYIGENFSLAHASYVEAITEHGLERFGFFKNIYQQNLEKYLEVATRANRAALFAQLAELKDVMKDIQPSKSIILPNSKEALNRAHFYNHSLNNVGLNKLTWKTKTDAIYYGG